MTAVPQPAHAAPSETLTVMHFYCDADAGYASPICGIRKPAAEAGDDCPLCGLIFDEIDAGERDCPYCRKPHWEAP